MVKKGISLIVIILVLLISSYGPVVSQQIDKELVSNYENQMNSAWPMKCHDLRHTSQSPYSTANNPHLVKWTYRTSLIDGSPIIDEQGNIYFGNWNYYFYSLNTNGTLRWRYKTGNIITGTPALADDGTIYIGSWDCKVHALNPNGTLKWKIGVGGSIGTALAIGEDGTIYLGHVNNDIVAVNPNGTIKWKYATGNNIASDPAIGNDGTIYIGSTDKYLYAMNPNGTLKWRYKTGDLVYGQPSIADDGTIYIPSNDKYLHALNPNGTLKWKFNIQIGSSSSAAIADDGTLYIGSDKLWAINPNGTLKWNLDINGPVHGSSPAISADGTIYFGTDTGWFYAVNPDGSEKMKLKIANKEVDSSPCISEKGIIYVGSYSTDNTGDGYGLLYAFGRPELTVTIYNEHYGLTGQPQNFISLPYGGYPPYSFLWEFGDGNTSNTQNTSHIYTQPGNYTITLTITDDQGNTTSASTWVWMQETNTAPDIPSIDGPTDGKIDTSYPYEVCTSDPDGTPVWYFIDWGDGKTTDWFGPHPSGEPVIKNHKWDKKGTYTVKVKAKDPYGAESDWGTLVVTMPVSVKVYEFPLLRLLCEILSWFPNLFPLLRVLGGLQG